VKQRGRESSRERGRKGVGASLSPRKGNGGGGHLLAGIDDGQPSTELLAAREEDDDLGVAGLGHAWLRQGFG
jgi:hypothetical protein